MGGGCTRVQVRTAATTTQRQYFEFGTDSLTRLYYRPERWFKDIPGGNVVPGVWGNMLSFLGGARSCIGYRFALVEYDSYL